MNQEEIIMHQAVVCIAPSVTDAERLVDSLKDSGFTADDISLMMPDSFGAQELAYEKHTKASCGFMAGTLFGAVLGGILAFFAQRGAFGTANLEQVIAAGPTMAVLAGIGVFGLALGIIGALYGMSLPTFEAKKFERTTRFGNTLMAVHTENEKEARVVEKLFKDGGGLEVQRTTEVSIRRPKTMEQSVIEADKRKAA
jgi:hypothetical protein